MIISVFSSQGRATSTGGIGGPVAFRLTRSYFSVQVMIRTLIVISILLSGAPARAALDLVKWDQLLGRAVAEGYVDYSQFRDNPLFDQLVDQIASSNTATMNRSEKLVFYINAYNILAIRGIVEGRSPSSVLGRYRYFRLHKYVVAGAKVNLNDLEHELIRPLGDARIHFAIVCASRSCPVLRSEAYTLERLDQQLESAAAKFINDTRRNGFSKEEGIANVSRIFEWFEEDFIAAEGSLQSYLALYVSDRDLATMLRDGQLLIKYQSYDWSLNGKLD